MKTRMILVALLASAAVASAQSHLVNLNGASENPANNSSATGFGTLNLNADNSLTYNITYSGLQGTWSANHIHGPGGVGTIRTNAPVIFTLNHTATGPNSGSLVGTTPVLTAQQLSWLNSEYLYVNIHSSVFPGGEIRGQIVAVPEPSTWALMGMGGLGALWYVRRRRSS